MRFSRTRTTKTAEAHAKGRERGRSTANETEASDAPPRKRATKKDEPENHTRLANGKKGHVTY